MPNPSAIHRQRIAIVASVLLLHALVLWALQTGLLQRAAALVQDIVVPVAFITPATPPRAEPPPAPPKAPLKPALAAKTPAVAPAAAPAPSPAMPLAPAPAAVADTTPAANAPVGVPTPATGAVVAAAATAAAAPSAPPPPPKLELPSSDAQYLQNPKSAYPRLSRQRNEQGKVVLSVFIGVDGTAQAAQVKLSSGYDRLDQAALATVKSWRYVPGKRSGVPEAMWFDVPINFVLE